MGAKLITLSQEYQKTKLFNVLDCSYFKFTNLHSNKVNLLHCSIFKFTNLDANKVNWNIVSISKFSR